MGVFTRRGIKVQHNKHTAALQAVRIEDCKEVQLLMKQHIGAPCKPLVKPGDKVQVGDVVGDTPGALCVPVHASVSGTVKRIEVKRIANGEDVQMAVIESDGLMDEPLRRAPVPETFDEFIEAVRASGLCGLGGAGFPAYAKLKSAAGEANVLLINAAECEPYITADHRELLDSTEDVIDGARLIMRFLYLRETIIGIEDNKTDAIRLLQSACARAESAGLHISVGVLPSKYPQGAEKMFIHSLTERVVPVGKLPSSVGCLVMNVGSVAFLGRYFKTGKPLVSRTLTVDGGAVEKPMNVRVPIGISLKDVIDFCGGVKEQPKKIILGGPMMGNAAPTLDAPVSKANNAIILFTEAETRIPQETPCIRCGACVAGCPMQLMPCTLEAAARFDDYDTLEKRNVLACIECGSCSYVCPAKRQLVQRIKMGKGKLREVLAARKAVGG
ncbi:MAG: electron transport complex subunit RsxC [Oscillospiraceae bacterium]|jgi:electron transport complex protein RnfC|nr:electron transport complex subunit RsxC [Oscillospiraceae bacterium]